MSELIEELLEKFREVCDAFVELDLKIRGLDAIIQVVMQRFGEAKKPPQTKVVEFDEKTLKALPWQENKSQTGWYVHKFKVPELWDAILDQEGWTYRLGEFNYVVFDSEKPFINKFPVKKAKEAK